MIQTLQPLTYPEQVILHINYLSGLIIQIILIKIQVFMYIGWELLLFGAIIPKLCIAIDPIMLIGIIDFCI